MIAGGELNKTAGRIAQGTDQHGADAEKTAASDLAAGQIWRDCCGKTACAQSGIPDGQKWSGRKTKRKGKMLRNLPKLLHIREMPEIQAVRIYLQGGGYRNGETPVPAGTVGYAQQNGMRVKVSRSNQPRKAEAGKMATPAQPKLRALGYRVKTGKRWKSPHWARSPKRCRTAGRAADSKTQW